MNKITVLKQKTILIISEAMILKFNLKFLFDLRKD